MAEGLLPRLLLCRSNSFELRDGPFVGDISRVQGGLRFDEHDMNFLVGDREMLDTARNNDKFAFAHDGFAVAEFHAQRAFDHQEEFVLVFMVMPDKLTLEFDGFDMALVYFTDDSRIPAVGKAAELFTQIDGFHGDDFLEGS
jgi:hypothetical protein